MENQEQVRAFLSRTPDAQLIEDTETFGRQFLPGQEDMDGFFYAHLKKMDAK